jgi:hypothetical protein
MRFDFAIPELPSSLIFGFKFRSQLLVVNLTGYILFLQVQILLQKEDD